MNEVHIVVAGGYDSFSMIRAYKNYCEACQLAEQCNEYQELAPQYSPLPESSEIEWEEHFAQYVSDVEKWEGAHPLTGLGGNLDSSPYIKYSVQTMEVV